MVGKARDRRDKKQRFAEEETSAFPRSNRSTQQNTEVAALNKKIHRLDEAKRRVNLTIKIFLCAFAVTRGYSTFSKVYGRRWGIVTAKDHAFQHRTDNNKMGLKKHVVPREMLQAFGVYPNIFNITEEMRSQFHPVIKFPARENVSIDSSTCLSPGGKLNEVYDYIIKDHTGKVDNSILVGEKKVPQLLATQEECVAHAKAFPNPIKGYDVGRYDEDRRGMYTSALFDDTNGNNEMGMRRTIHVGIDLGAPVGTEVYAFEDGIVHSVGYNPEIGDYGHVIVIEHTLCSSTKIYALYGHLAKSVLKIKCGDKIGKGQVIGHIGNTDENGGWTGTHVHFQLAKNPPKKKHDMPGAVTVVDRDAALLEYVDPRYILGELH